MLYFSNQGDDIILEQFQLNAINFSLRVPGTKLYPITEELACAFLDQKTFYRIRRIGLAGVVKLSLLSRLFFKFTIYTCFFLPKTPSRVNIIV